MSGSKRILIGPFRHGLTFIATLAFIASFFGSRLFATLYPSTVVMTGQIHIHHFWYGMGLISLAGWIAIAWPNERISRPCAILYGLGAGFVGDEIGLLLTLGNYQSELTYEFFIGAMSLIIIMTLLVRYRAVVFRDVIQLSIRERAILVGFYVAAFFAFLLFTPSHSLLAVPFVLAGLGILLLEYARQRRSSTRGTELVRPLTKESRCYVRPGSKMNEIRRLLTMYFPRETILAGQYVSSLLVWTLGYNLPKFGRGPNEYS